MKVVLAASFASMNSPRPIRLCLQLDPVVSAEGSPRVAKEETV